MKNLGLDPHLMMMRIEDVIIKTIISAEDKMFRAFEKYVPFRNNCFQLFGFDVMIDSKLQPWLIEVNLSPSLGCDSDIDFQIKSKLASNLLNLVGIEPIQNRRLNEAMMNQKLFRYAKPEKNLRKKKQKKGLNLRKKEMQVISETREEIQRANKFKLIFPSYNVCLYKGFFEEQRPYNAILMNE
jgi:tubulin polyglutamylase TTLL5